MTRGHQAILMLIKIKSAVAAVGRHIVRPENVKIERGCHIPQHVTFVLCMN